MPSSFAKAPALTHRNTVQGDSESLSSVNADLLGIKATSQGPLIGSNKDAEVLQIIRRVRSELELKQEGMAAVAGVKASQFSNALNGTGNFAVTWLWAQGDAFLLRFFELAMEARGLTPANKRAQRAFRIAELVRLLTEDQP